MTSLTEEAKSIVERLTDSQFGVLHTLMEFGPKEAEEILLPPGMDGKRKTKLVCNFMISPMLQRMEARGLIHVVRGDLFAPKNAVWKSGNMRRRVVISITDKARTLLQSKADSEGGAG